MSTPRLERLEVMLGRVLLAGVLLASGCLAVGLIMWMAGGYPIAANRVLAAGLIVLMATPILRVVVSLSITCGCATGCSRRRPSWCSRS